MNLTAEEQVDEDDGDYDEDLPDFSALKVSAEEALLFVDHANGATRHSFIEILLVKVTGLIPGPICVKFSMFCLTVSQFRVCILRRLVRKNPNPPPR